MIRRRLAPAILRSVLIIMVLKRKILTWLSLFLVYGIGTVGVPNSPLAAEKIQTVTTQTTNINKPMRIITLRESPPSSEPIKKLEEDAVAADPVSITEPVEKISKATKGYDYILGAEDKIKITVFGEQDLSGSFKIGGDGNISMPLVGIVQLQNLTLRQAEDLIEEKLRDGYLKNPSISIEVAESRPFYILGEVRRPGSYNYINGMSVLQAIAISGGFTYRANRKSVDILRGQAAPSKPLSVLPEMPVQAGDIIFVRERFF